MKIIIKNIITITIPKILTKISFSAELEIEYSASSFILCCVLGCVLGTVASCVLGYV